MPSKEQERLQKDLHTYIRYRLQKKYGRVDVVSAGEAQHPYGWVVVCRRCLPSHLSFRVKAITLTPYGEVESKPKGNIWTVLAGQCDVCDTVYYATYRRV